MNNVLNGNFENNIPLSVLKVEAMGCAALGWPVEDYHVVVGYLGQFCVNAHLYTYSMWEGAVKANSRKHLQLVK